ncbi:MAG: hypothetical protein JWM10_1452 [Myxococcaceae bacterium]|nr:hypothetical protein [Myxococcaceae bacterium]
MANDQGADEEYFRNELSQAVTALRAIAKQAPLLVAMGNAAELGGFIDQFVAMAERTAAEAKGRGADDVARDLGELVVAAQQMRHAGQA